MIFKTPAVLLLIPLVLALLIWSKARRKEPAFRFPSSGLVEAVGQTLKTRLSQLPFYLRLVAVVLLVIALAGPRKVNKETKITTEGIDIVLAIDASGSMVAEDFVLDGQRVNRLAAVKNVVKDFIAARHHDRIGLVAFAGRAYTVSPLTTDYQWLITNLDRIKLGMIEDGTAIGSAIAASLTRLDKEKAKSKVIILLTDGINNAGTVKPLEAAKAAKALGVRIYTIGAGTKGFAPVPQMDIFGRKVYRRMRIDIDDDVLKKIASLTGGQYFRATDTASLKEIYKEIDSLEKTKIHEYGYVRYEELFPIFLLAGLALLLLEILLSNTLLMRVP